MVVPLFLVVALLTAATPAPEPTAASSTPLKEIGHVYSNGACTAIVVRANSAISSALRNDQTMTLMVASLRTVNLDSPNKLERLNGRTQLERYAADLRQSAVHAMAEVKQLRKLADESVDPVRKAELKDFADALAGALGRQQKVGADLQGMLVRIAGRESRVDVWQQMTKTSPELTPPWPDYSDVHFDTSVYNKMAVNEAQYVELQVPSIQDDESHAADHVIGAVNGC
ncbi:MAG: hypothetical protein JO349_08520 [Candidatus Eremiobacteraeota bacterium]|nr:hypothetical protein [Candidatus Eremiobacteraeota bacterium]